MTVSPLCLRIMLLAYYSAEPLLNTDNTMLSMPGLDAQGWLHDEGLVDKEMRATPRGRAWVEFILATPLPEQVWRLPQGVIV